MKVYRWCMTRTNIDIDDDLVAEVIRKYDLSSKREAVDLALRKAAGSAITPDFVWSLKGIGWEGDLDALRGGDADTPEGERVGTDGRSGV
ncbi:Arc/MetJ family transcription regulator [Knoellia remsis]|uniref:Arc/MetJ family transcription regulator n=2 Tax=Knoellia remsis TaxID=407159 RepID=A0A2T0V0A3_9MICO|nr:Arc/MetJ family transcription regulator [Knoellia remsis]